MTVAVGDVVRITAVAQWAAQDFFTNTFYVKVTTQDEPTDTLFMDKVAIHMESAYVLINPDIVSSINYDHIEGQNVTQDVLLPDKTWPSLTNGGDAGAALPTQNTACVFYRTLRPKTRAAQYIWPYSEASNENGGVISAVAVTLLQAFGDLWVAGILQTSVEADLGAYNPFLARFTPVIAAVVPTRYRTQRRRRIGVGS